MESLRKELKELNDNIKVRTIIIASDGNVFSAGHDLNELVCFLLTKVIKTKPLFRLLNLVLQIIKEYFPNVLN